MIIVLHSPPTAYKMPAVLFTGPVKKSDTEHHPWDEIHHPHTLPRCTGADFPDLDQSPAVLPGPFHRYHLLPLSQVGVFLAETAYQARESHSQESLPSIQRLGNPSLMVYGHLACLRLAHAWYLRA